MVSFFSSHDEEIIMEYPNVEKTIRKKQSCNLHS